MTGDLTGAGAVREATAEGTGTAGPPLPLIGLAHGSRDPRAGAAIAALLRAVADARPGLQAEPAFLDLTDPDLGTAVRALDADRAVVVPLLFSSAFHARVDAPEAVERAERETGTCLVRADILGLGAPVLRALRRAAERAGIGDEVPVLLLAVGSSVPAANAAVQALAEQWSTHRPAPVRAVFATSEPRAVPALEQARGQGPVAVVPLFLAPGLLLDQVRDHPAAAGVPFAEPLGTLLAGLVLERYDAALPENRAASR
ncbi:sirohydrochlorin chelatase [Nakamurella endophytica]|uniref:sirohydrochlorin chelatase n=1 Tax=Nakamurella endophytica TaxID=1748367 RepID=UPI001E40DF91|nr:CbiX/SirB N-terminal domain-containing protein [Nakamurella endophytica]